MDGLKCCNDFIMLESSNDENDVKLYLGKKLKPLLPP